MDIMIGIAMAVAVGLFTSVVGLERDRALYPVVMIVIASYYDLFAVMAGGSALAAEAMVSVLFVAAATIGFRTNLWIVVAALVAHGIFDAVHGLLIDNTGVPSWWPLWCLSYDVAAGAYLAWRLGAGHIKAADVPHTR